VDANGGRARDFLGLLGVRSVPAATVPFDPGYDPATIEAHLQQSAALIPMVKLSMATWIVADARAVQCKIEAARRLNVPVVCGGGPFEIAVAQHVLPEYLDLCAATGFTRIEAGEGFTGTEHDPVEVVGLAHARGLDVQFELGRKHTGPMDASEVTRLVEKGRRWLDAGALQLVVEARESAAGAGLFHEDGSLDARLAEQFADVFGLATLVFEAPTKSSQFAMLDLFGNEVWLTNVRFEELLRVEIYRRGLHSDSFARPHLRPHPPAHCDGDLDLTGAECRPS